MKVLLFTTQFYQVGGAERLALELAEALNHRGVHADILSQFSKELPGVAEATDALAARGIPEIGFLGLEVHSRFSAITTAVRRLRQFVVERRYDVVETSGLTPSLIAAIALKGIRVRHVVGIHAVYSREHQRGLRYQIMGHVMRWRRDIRFYAISDFVRSSWIEYSGIKPSRIRTVLNSVSEESFESEPDRIGVRKELRLPESSRLLLFVGRLVKSKGIDTLLKALGPHLEQHNAYLLYVGSDTEPPEGFFADEAGLLERLHSSLEREVWSARVQFLGIRNDVPRLMAACDALVHPVLLEGFGLVLVEALAAGLPVIASNVQGIPEVLAGTKSMMVPPDDPNALKKAVLEVLHWSPVKLAQAAESGRNRAEEFRTEKRTASMISLFEDVQEGRF